MYLETRILFNLLGGGMFVSNAMETFEAIFVKFSGLVDKIKLQLLIFWSNFGSLTRYMDIQIGRT